EEKVDKTERQAGVAHSPASLYYFSFLFFSWRSWRLCGFSWFFFLEYSLGAEPLPAALRPRRTRVFPGPQTETVSTRRIDMQLGGNTVAFESKIHARAVVRFVRIVIGVGEERRRALLADADLRGEFLLVLGEQIGRINQHGEVRPAANLVD